MFKMLPIEILGNIFKFLVHDEFEIFTLMQVCKDWTAALSMVCKDKRKILEAFKLLCEDGNLHELQTMQAHFKLTNKEVKETIGSRPLLTSQLTM